jgi:hypothetical protein
MMLGGADAGKELRKMELQEMNDGFRPNPSARSASAIAKGLQTVLSRFSDDELRGLSKHLSGEAFDVQPVTENAEQIKADIRALPGVEKFLDKEGGLVRWHAQFS